MVSKLVITLIYPIYRWNNPLILTIDPNFQRDIQACRFFHSFRKVQQFDLRDVSKSRLPEADLVMASDVLYASCWRCKKRVRKNA